MLAAAADTQQVRTWTAQPCGTARLPNPSFLWTVYGEHHEH